MMERQPNTIYVASLSYGKDSIAMLHVIKDILHYPLDRIIHAEVWATDTIPADLPPMVEFKAKADAIIKERWGIEVEHVCAMKKSQNVNVERDGSCITIISTKSEEKETDQEKQSDSLCNPKDGAKSSNMSKLTYQDIFYRTLKPKQEKVMRGGGYCQKQGRHTDSRQEKQIGATANSKQECSTRIYGYPMLKGEWCRSYLKTSVRICDKMESILHRGTQAEVPFRTSPRTTGRK